MVVVANVFLNTTAKKERSRAERRRVGFENGTNGGPIDSPHPGFEGPKAS